MIQNSAEWFQARLGRATASRVADVIARTKSGYSASRENYLAQLVAERLTGIPAESYVNGPMQWGQDKEPEARAQYAFAHDVDVVEVGFIPHPTIEWSGGSPDGVIGDDGLIEIKAPNTSTAIATLLGEPIAGKYIVQMQWLMECTGRSYCDFVSYDPRLPEYARLFVKRIRRDEEMIAGLRPEVMMFLEDVERKTAAVRALEHVR